MTIPLRVLLVEDSENDAELLLRELGQAGYDVSSERVETARAMRAALDGQKWDLVIADYSMPRFSAPEALALLKKVGLDLPFIIVSGTVGEEIAVESMKAGAHDYLSKGSLKRLVPAVERELQQVEQRRARRQADEHYRLLFERNPAGILRNAPDGRILECNDAAVSIFGLTAKEELVGRNIRDFFADPGDRERILARLRSEGVVTNLEIRLRRSDGSISWVLAGMTLIAGDAERAEFIEGLFHDITERKRLEDQLRQSQRMEAIGRLAGGVAHDFNNLLTAILGYSDLLYNQLPEDSPLRGEADEIRKAAHSAAALTRQLLAFSRKQLLVPEIVNPNELVSGMEKMLRRLIGEHIEVSTALDPALAAVKADPGQLEQVIMNLAVNARDAMPRGGKLTIETANVELDESYARNRSGVVPPGAYVLISVSDTGMGMDETTRAQVFEPFFTTKEKGKGTGLGLATVYGIVKQSGGSIWVYSEPGKGTSFKIYLPRAEESKRKEKAAARPEPMARGTETVLLVEDEDAVRTLARLALEAAGYRVLEARHGGEALSIAEGHDGKIDLMLTDTVMPGMGGPELAGRMASLRPETRALFMSGYADDAVFRHGILESKARFLQKPFTAGVLTRKVREVLDSAALSE
jgi:two-component system cell cycle sensor histidine kinase/response regulator CckA